jgi:hypothetical protein
MTKFILISVIVLITTGCGSRQSKADTLLFGLPKTSNPYVGSFIYDQWKVDVITSTHIGLIYSYGDGPIVRKEKYFLSLIDVELEGDLPRNSAVDIQPMKTINGNNGLRIKRVPHAFELRKIPQKFFDRTPN